MRRFKFSFCFGGVLKFLSVGLCLNLSAQLETNTYSLYTLSTLLPLPSESIEELASLNLRAAGCEKDVLSRDVYTSLPRLYLTRQSHEEEYAKQRLVALRWDPVNLELRLVFQPLELRVDRDHGRQFHAEDVALHYFLKTESAHEFRRVLDIYKEQIQSENSFQLGVFPANREQLSFVKSFLCRILENDLWAAHKLTFMTERRGRMIWHFGGFTLLEEPGDFSPELGEVLPIANVGAGQVDHNNLVNVPIQRMVRVAPRIRANVSPLANTGDHLNNFFASTTQDLSNQDALESYRIASRIENPNIHTPNTVDCVSCHAVESTKYYLRRFFEVPRFDEEFLLPNTYSFDASIDNNTFSNTANLRMFGYLGRTPSVAKRVLLESYLFKLRLSGSAQ